MSVFRDLETSFAVVCFLFVIAIVSRNLRTGRRAFLLPPGPMRLPLLGNVHQLPSTFQHKTFKQWAAKYGDIFYLEVFHKPAIVINSAQMARDLMEKRGSKYSDRPRTVIFTELMGLEHTATLLHYGDRWRLHRKWLQTAFHAQTTQRDYQLLQQRSVQRLLSTLLDSPGNFNAHIKKFAGAIMMEVTYGHRVVPGVDDGFIEWADDVITRIFETGSPGASLIDFFPILKYIPGWVPWAEVQRKASRMRPEIQQLHDVPYERVKNAMNAGSARTSFLASLIDKVSVDGEMTEDDMLNLKGVAGVVYLAGVDTTVTVMLNFVLAMVLHPEVYAKAQAEIDRVVGQSRLPDFDDRLSMPYLECVLKEVYRWASPTPFAVPHRVTDDDEYLGYHIPAGCVIMPNIWAMTRDPAIYPDPDSFIPERFANLDADTSSKLDPTKLIFGFGRRICPGRTFADSTVWLFITNIMSTMDICKARDGSGKEITPEPVFIDGSVVHLAPFECDIRPRSKKAEEIVMLANAASPL
ncbi:uncharacterized protein FIBRA_00331 [Fibroporia radiculosa]|uniref:Cytochrome P450 n=1 Tax=Fibroporia radiculosa TaxID=599839 RepID=J7RGX4_9APHY|nr:uncharacterized protein FIBRA_00331 [Fibroporia radiculosa]CCL98337.1 predicted protein [Fibroporia radiculosa]